MKEDDYVLVTALQRLRASYELLTDSMACSAAEGMEKRYAGAVKAIWSMIRTLEEAVNVAMDEEVGQ